MHLGYRKLFEKFSNTMPAAQSKNRERKLFGTFKTIAADIPYTFTTSYYLGRQGTVANTTKKEENWILQSKKVPKKKLK